MCCWVCGCSFLLGCVAGVESDVRSGPGGCTAPYSMITRNPGMVAASTSWLTGEVERAAPHATTSPTLLPPTAAPHATIPPSQCVVPCPPRPPLTPHHTAPHTDSRPAQQGKNTLRLFFKRIRANLLCTVNPKAVERVVNTADVYY